MKRKCIFLITIAIIIPFLINGCGNSEMKKDKTPITVNEQMKESKVNNTKNDNISIEQKILKSIEWVYPSKLGTKQTLAEIISISSDSDENIIYTTYYEEGLSAINDAGETIGEFKYSDMGLDFVDIVKVC